MRDFDYEVWQRKILARQAKHKKNGSKSRQCSLPSDRMTNKQWKERCGEVVTYDLGRPMGWIEFKSMPADMKKEYVERLIQKYSVTASDLARMFGCGATAVTKLCKSDDVGIEFHAGKRMNAEQRARFAEFLSVAEPCQPDEQRGEPKLEFADSNKQAEGGAGCDTGLMTMTNVTLRFDGPFDPSMIYNSLRQIIPADADACVDIAIKINV